MSESCNIGYSTAVEVALIDALRRHGEVVSTSKDPHMMLRLGSWRLVTYGYSEHPRWEPVSHLSRDGGEPICGQCAFCSDVTYATIKRTTGNLPHLEPETAHSLEDAVMREVLLQIMHGSPYPVPLATAAYEMASQKRVRWYA